MQFAPKQKVSKRRRLKTTKTLRRIADVSKPYFRYFNVLVSFLASIVTVLGAVVILVNYQQISDVYGRTFRTNSYWEDVLNSLNVQQNLSFFSDKLGKPTFTNRLTGSYVQHVFVQSSFYVTALVDQDEKVLTHTITIRTKDFTPYIRKSRVRLGVTPFSELAAENRLTGGQADTSDYHYYEELYYRGYQGKWLTYVYASSDAGLQAGFVPSYLPTSSWRDYKSLVENVCTADDPSADMLDSRPGSPHAPETLGQHLLEHRDQVAINTVGFVSAMPTFLCDIIKDTDDLPVFGPNRDQTILLE